MTKERFVIVTTAHRGVFGGYTSNISGATIKLRDARNCIYWSEDMKGFMGLANMGPSKTCKLGPKATITLKNITAVIEVTLEAENKWVNLP